MTLRKILGLKSLLISAMIAAAAALVVIPSISKTSFSDDESNGSYSLAQGMLVHNTIRAVAKDYLEPERVNPKAMLKASLDAVERLVPEFLVTYDDSQDATVTVGVATKKFKIGSLSKLDDLDAAVREVLEFIDQNYAGDIEKPEIEYAACDGMLSELDPHSSFLSPKIYKEFRIGTMGEFGGLGIVISIKDGNLTVVAPLEGTPAWKAGIKAGDVIVQIGDESTINMSLTDAVNKLRGKIGTSVKLVVSRPGQANTFSVTLTRAIINIDSIQKLALIDNGKRIGYIKVKSFQANTDEDFTAALKALHEGGELDGLIIDVRNNPGGLLNQAIDIADHFLSSGTIVTTVAQHGVLMEREDARGADVEPDYPIAVIINEGSASASEIVAGALKANDRAIVMGHRSFGKGSVQTLFEVGNESAVKLTIAQYLPAGTMSIQTVGVTPDVELVPKTVDRDHMDLVGDVVQSEKDLEKHLEKSGESLEQPAYRASYFQPYEKTDEEGASRLKEYSNVPDVQQDFAVQLAKKLLSNSSSSSRKEMLGGIKTPLAESEKEQDDVIYKKLSQLGCDWSTAPKNGKPLLKIAYNITRGGSMIKAARAGTKVDLELTATNIGNGPFSQLVAVGQSESPLLKNREFVFGRIEPGQSRSARVPIEVPLSLPTQELTMDIGFHEAHGNVPESLKAVIPVERVEPPVFAFSYSIANEPATTANKTVKLALNAFNVGKGASSSETVATLANKSGSELFIERGRAVLGAIPTGSSRQATFLFHTTKKFGEPEIKLELTILDPKSISILTKKITIDMKTGESKPPPNERYQPPSIALDNPVTETSKDVYQIKGAISDTDPIKDYFIFVGDKKVAYRPNASESPQMALDAVLPLKDGNNMVSLAARDDIELIGRELIVINRSSGKDAESKPE